MQQGICGKEVLDWSGIDQDKVMVQSGFQSVRSRFSKEKRVTCSGLA